jgi:hypothetical protein
MGLSEILQYTGQVGTSVQALHANRNRLEGFFFEPLEKTVQFEWPVPDASSGLLKLELACVNAPAEVVAHMLHSCKLYLASDVPGK